GGPDGPVRRLEACQSPVWDTVLAVVALADAGVPPDDPALARAASWLLEEEIRGPGDWQVRRPRLDPGGWAFEFDNDGYPDIDDTAEILLALRRVSLAGPGGGPGAGNRHPAVQRGLRWMAGMQSRDGGWGAFDADNTSVLATKLPFCDFGAVTDPPSADVTAHVVEALSAEGLAGTAAVRRGVVWLLRAQESDGSWFGRGGAAWPGRARGCPLAHRTAATGWQLGRAGVHRHGLPRRLLHQLPPVPSRLPAERARPVPGRPAVTPAGNGHPAAESNGG